MSHITIPLPKDTPSHVKEGSAVAYNASLTDGSSVETIVFPIPQLLAIKPQEVSKYLTKLIGAPFEKDEVLAKKGGMMSEKHVKATFSGTIMALDAETGNLIVSPNGTKPQPIVSPVEGKVTKLDEHGVTIEFTGELLYGKHGANGIGRGTLLQISEPNEKVVISHLNADNCKNAVLLGGHFDRGTLTKAASLGAAAILGIAIDPQDFVYFDNNPLFETPLLVISSADFTTLKAHRGKQITVEGLHRRVFIQ